MVPRFAWLEKLPSAVTASPRDSKDIKCAPGSILGVTKNFSDDFFRRFILDAAETNRRHFLECVKLENVDRTI